MSGVNKVILLGYVGKDPESRTFENGDTICNFSLATSEAYKNKQGERITNTEWHNIKMVRQSAEIAEKYVKKGSLVYVEGKKKTRSYEANTGETKYVVEIECHTITLLDRKGESGSSSNDSGDGSEEGKDDLPF